MRQYRAEIEPHGKKWRWQVKEKFYSPGEPVYKVVCINWLTRDYLEGKARTFEKAARAATDALGALPIGRSGRRSSLDTDSWGE